MRLLAILLLAAGAAWAQSIERTSLDMLPNRIEREQRNKLYGAFYRAQGPVNTMNQRIRQIDAALAKKPKPAEAAKLRLEKTGLRAKINAQHRAMFQAFRDAGLSDGDIALLRGMPRGVLREERHNHSLVLAAPGLTGEQRALVTRMVSAIDAAQRALHVQHNYVRGAMKDLEPTVRRQIDGSFYNQRQQMEKRFWQLVYYALTPAQMVAVRKNLSPRFGYISQLEQHIYLLPELSNSQATRVRALFREHESETAADVAEQRRLQQATREKSLPKDQLDALRVQQRDCNERLAVTRERFRDAIKASLNEEQLNALRSIPPMLNTGDLYQGMRRTITEMAPTPEQSAAIAKVRDALQKQQREIQRDANRDMGDMRGADLGPESPQMMSMQMMQRRSQAKGLALVRAAGHGILTGTLTPDQAADWIVAPGLQP